MLAERVYREDIEGGVLLHRARPDLRRLYVELTSRCRGGCVACVRRSWDEPVGDMSVDLLREVIAGAVRESQLERVHFGGIGEPFLHPGVMEAIALVKGAGLKVTISTNGSDLRTLAGELVAMQVDELVVSCDSPDPGRYGEIRGSSLAALEEGLEALGRAKARAGSVLPRLVLEFVAMRGNLADLRDMPRFARRWGAASLLVTNLLPYTRAMAGEILYTGPNAPMRPAESGSLRPDASALVWAAAAREWFTWGTVDLPRMAWGAARRCRFVGTQAAVVGWDGKVSSCIPLSHNYTFFIFGQPKCVRRYTLGELGSQDLLAIWMSEEYVKFRSRVRRYDFPSCVDCALGETCDYRSENRDCWGGDPSCADCLWAQDIIRCP